jgi:hypothetical protein
VDEALRQWDAWEANLQRPGGAPSGPPPPSVTRRSLTELRALLLEELTRLDAEADTPEVDGTP